MSDSSKPIRSSTNDNRSIVSLLTGTTAGVGAWLAGYLVTYAVVAPDIRESPLNRLVEAFEGEAATYEMVGWVFYNAHFVETVFRDVPLVGTTTTSYVGGEDGFTALLYLVPVVTLLAVGLGLGWYRGEADPAKGAVAGVMVLPGYFLATAVGVHLVEVTLGEASGAPDPLAALFLAGIVYPALWAGMGGAIGAIIAGDPRSAIPEHRPSK